MYNMQSVGTCSFFAYKKYTYIITNRYTSLHILMLFTTCFSALLTAATLAYQSIQDVTLSCHHYSCTWKMKEVVFGRTAVIMCRNCPLTVQRFNIIVQKGTLTVTLHVGAVRRTKWNAPSLLLCMRECILKTVLNFKWEENLFRRGIL